jgi:hydroxymethylpyrimidine kinase/phosphomethylpyrimidine kinase
MVSTSGSQLLPSEAVKALRTDLLPMTTLLTPNIPEALLLLRDVGVDVQDPRSLPDVIQLARELHELGPKYVLLKGGHLPLMANQLKPENPKDASIVVDVLYSKEATISIQTDYLTSKNTHGTGCSLASAIAANLANGLDISRAVRRACRFVEAGIKTSVDIGRGNGPINHFHSLYTLPFAPYVLSFRLTYMGKKNVTNRGIGVVSWSIFLIGRTSGLFGNSSRSMSLWRVLATARCPSTNSKHI